MKARHARTVFVVVFTVCYILFAPRVGKPMRLVLFGLTYLCYASAIWAASQVDWRLSFALTALWLAVLLEQKNAP